MQISFVQKCPNYPKGIDRAREREREIERDRERERKIERQRE